MSPFIETINKLDKRWYLLLLFILVVLLIAGTIFFLQFQEQQKAISLEKSISTLKMQAIKAEYDGELDKADSLYTKALDDAYDSNCPMKVIEIFSRLVQTKIKNNKIRQADSLMQKAIKLALFIKGTDASDSNLDVWMSDMANAYYKRGEISTSEVVKEYCMRHYLDIQLSLEDQYDCFLIGRSNLLQQWLGYNGRESEAIPYSDKTFDYVKRTKPDDPEIVTRPFFIQAHKLAKERKLTEAVVALKHALLLDHKPLNSVSILDQDKFVLNLAQLAEEAGDLQAAKTLYYKELELEKKYINKPTNFLGTCENMLGFLEQRTGNLAAAAKLYRESLDCFDQCQPDIVTPANRFLHPDNQHYSGQVFAMEHLAQIELKLGNMALAHSLQARAKKIRAENPHWIVRHPDPDKYYLSAGFFPFQIDFLPTHLSLADIKQN